MLDGSNDQCHKRSDTTCRNISETTHIPRHDYCLAMDEEASIGCGDTRAFCPTEPYNFSSGAAGAAVEAISCDRCAMVTMENWDQRIWLGGEVRWAPFARSEEDEMQLEGSLTSQTRNKLIQIHMFENQKWTQFGMGQLYGFQRILVF